MGEATFAGVRETIIQELTNVGTAAGSYLPTVASVAGLLAIGWLAAKSLEWVVTRSLVRLRVDRFALRTRIAEHVGMDSTPSAVLGKLSFWLVLLAFSLSAAQTLGVEAVGATLEELAGFAPNVIGAVLVALLGGLMARVLGGLTMSAAVAAKMPNATRLAFLARVAVLGLTAIVAVEQLGLATSILLGPLLVIGGSLAATVGLAFALGAAPIVTQILAGHFLKQSLPRGAFVEVDGRRGIIERIGATDTLFNDGEQRWSIPNAQLLDRTVVR